METTTKTFDAVAESRKWKEAVARETEGLSPEQVVAYFDREAVHRRFQDALERSREQETGSSSQSKATRCAKRRARENSGHL
jgi:hypothetical protein